MWAGLFAFLVVMAGISLARIGLGVPGADSIGAASSHVAIAILAALLAESGAELAATLRYNQFCVQASQRDRDLHYWVSARVEEVRLLEATPEWDAHYRRHSPVDAIWRYRRRHISRDVLLCTQAGALLMWAFLIHPHCDVLLAAGAVTNLLHLSWQMLSLVCCCGSGCRKRRHRPVQEWFDELE